MIDKQLLAEAEEKCKQRAEKLPALSEIQNKPEDVCPVQWALQLITAARKEACGKTVLCRDGLWQLQLILTSITDGTGTGDDIDLARDILNAMKSVGCANTKKIAELVLYSMDNYSDEWDIHARRKRCTALQCPAYYSVYIDPETCTGCGACLKAAPAGAIEGGDGMIHVVKDDAALKSDEFYAVCPVSAIKKAGAVKPKVPEAPIPVGSFEGAAGGRRRRRG